MRRFGYAGDARFFGIRFPVRLAPTPVIIADLDAHRFERAEALLVRRYLPAGVEVLELGGSMGVISSVVLSRRPKRLVSYEAVPDLAQIARRVVGLNHPLADYCLENRAVGGSGDREVSFAWSAGTPLAGAAGAPASSEQACLRVPAEDLPTIVKKHNLGPGTWLVSDVEGMEFELLLNQGAAFATFDGVIMECHSGDFAGAERDQAFAESLLTRLGFRLRQRIGPVICMTR